MTYTISANDYAAMQANDVTLRVNGMGAGQGVTLEPGDYVEFTAGNGRNFFMTGNSCSIRFTGRDGNNFATSSNPVLSANDTVATWADFQNPDQWSVWSELVLSTEGGIQPPDYELTQTDIDNLTNSNAYIEKENVVLGVGDPINYGDVLTVKTEPGYVFVVDPINGANVYFEGIDYDNGIRDWLRFSLNPEKTEGVATFRAPNGTDPEWLFLFSETEQVDEVSGSNNVYIIDVDKLNELNAERFVSGGVDIVYDYGQFILSVLELPFSIPEELILDGEYIKLATLTTSVEAPKLKTDKIRVDLGEISIAATDNNLLDYSGVVALLHLPRSPAVAIEPQYVIGETLSVEYIIDAYTGVATVNISSTKIDGVIHTMSVDIGVNIPYASVPRSLADNTNIVVGGDNGVTKPFIELTKNEAILPNGFFTNPIVDEDAIGNQSGFVQIEQVELQTKANSSDAQKIRAILASGVIVK